MTTHTEIASLWSRVQLGYQQFDAWRERAGEASARYFRLDEEPAQPQPRQRRHEEPAPVRTLGTVTVLGISKLVKELNTNIDDHPHLVLFGNSGSGKTTLAQLIAGLRTGRLVILDPKRPKGWEGAKWGGLPYVTRATDGSYGPLVAALKAVVAEMDRRYAVMERASTPFEQLSVIFDEARNAITECPELADLYKKVISIGREVGVRLIILSTNDRVKSLGLDGEGDMRDSLRRIHLGKFARDVYPEVARLGKENHLHAVVELEGWTPFDNSKTLELLQRVSLPASKAWDGVRANCQTGTAVVEDEDEDLLAGLLTQTSMAATERPKMAVHTAPDQTSLRGIPGLDAVSAGMPNLSAILGGLSRDERIQALVALGVSANAIVATLGGDRNTVLARVRELRGSEDAR
ncbi:hypothetical protein SE17_20100 [Kouleothrix aurantiaca]|uniref:AAA+ ATPase domain-containing protein n=1 Tax=Kouleothrix aurantiaca TaxID=186479 RepID=A0A0P9F572_9CHLR|nr:hypothetical protein SE17_20100 [Kouleothrix aurantiaca]